MVINPLLIVTGNGAIFNSKTPHVCEHCATTIFEVKHGMLIFERKHHGETHTTVISLAELYRQYIETGLTMPTINQPLDFFGGVAARG